MSLDRRRARWSGPGAGSEAQCVYKGIVIRPARVDDLSGLQDIERAAGASFGSVGMSLVAEHEPASLRTHATYQEDGRAWVATDQVDHPVAYLLLDIIDEAGHVEQVSVHPSYSGRRLGAALLDTASTWTRGRGLTTVTLTTFAEVPWNAPYYEQLGFGVLSEDEVGAGLRRVRQHEAAMGLDRWPAS